MKTAFLLAALLLSAMVHSQMTYDQAWTYIQTERGKVYTVLYGASSSPSDIRAALAKCEELKKWCQSEGIRDLTYAPGAAPQIYLQINDILVSQIHGYARLGDLTPVLRNIRELHASITAPGANAAKNPNQYSFYANSLAGDAELGKFLPNIEITNVILDFRRRDPEGVLASLPYKSGDHEDLSVADRIAGLSQIWSEAKYNFANFDLVKNLDWDASYQRFLPLVISAKNRYAYYNLLREFMAQLKDSHTDVNLPRSLRMKEEVMPPLWLRLVQGKVVVFPQPSPDLQKLGLQLGDVVEKVDGVAAVEYGQKRWGSLVSSSTPQDRDVRIYSYMLLRGPRGKAVRLGVARADGSRRTITIPRDDTLKGVGMPTSEFSLLPDGTAYFSFNTCSSYEPATEFRKRLPEIQKAGRLIIDCRWNDGGDSDVGYEIVRNLIDKPVVAGRWETRAYRPSFRASRMQAEPLGGTDTVTPRAPYFSGPVAVLAGPVTFSAGEDFLAAFKMSKRGPIVGMPTGGSTGQPLFFSLPGGGSARICSKRDRMGDGTEFVGIGVMPDIRIESTIQSIREGKDPVLQAALDHLAKKGS